MPNCVTMPSACFRARVSFHENGNQYASNAPHWNVSGSRGSTTGMLRFIDAQVYRVSELSVALVDDAYDARYQSPPTSHEPWKPASAADLFPFAYCQS